SVTLFLIRFLSPRRRSAVGMWESRGLGEISKSRWASVGRVHGDGISTAADRRLPKPAAMPRRGKLARVAIDAPQFHLHEADSPIAPIGFGYPHEFSDDGLADKHEVAAPLNLPIRAHPAYLAGGVVPGILEPLRIGAGGPLIRARRRRLREGFVRR